MKPVGAVWRLAIVGAIAAVLFVLLANVVTQPVAPAVRSYTAEFTDSSGLYAGADVRVRGVRVGKIQSVELKRRKGESVSAVGFTLENRYGVLADTRLAIKYQSLTGSRYIDVVNSAEGYSNAQLITQVPTTMTQPSFDITTLFNGLQPVLATLAPEEINAFASHAVDFLTGDGGGLAPMLDSIHTLTRFVANRQEVTATVVRNLSTVADAMGGQSQKMIQIIDWANRVIDGALTIIDQFRDTELFSTGFLDPLLLIIKNLGFPNEGNNGARYITMPPGHENLNTSNIDEGMDRAITNLDDFIQSTKLVPVMWDNVGPPSGSAQPQPCSHGRFELPEQMDVLLNGQRVVLCHH